MKNLIQAFLIILVVVSLMLPFACQQQYSSSPVSVPGTPTSTLTPTLTFTPTNTGTPTITPTFVCSGASGTFGSSVPGNAIFSTGNLLWISPFTLTANGRVTSIVLSECSGGLACTILSAVYGDSGGAPNTLIGQPVTTIVSNSTCGTFNTTLNYPGQGIALTPGNYWLAEEGYTVGGGWPDLGGTYNTAVTALVLSATLPLPNPWPISAYQNYGMGIYANWVCP